MTHIDEYELNGRHAELLARARHLGAATLFEAAGATGALPSAIKPLEPTSVVAGWAVPVATSPKDNLWIHRAVAEARPGDVLVISTGGDHDAGYWGEVLSVAAATRGIAGVVVDACVRDADAIARVGVPVYARGLSVRGTTKDPDLVGSVGVALRFGDTDVSAGDAVVGDRDGVVVIARERLDDVVAAAEQRERFEAGVFERLRAGETTLEIYPFPPRP